MCFFLSLLSLSLLLFVYFRLCIIMLLLLLLLLLGFPCHDMNIIFFFFLNFSNLFLCDCVDCSRVRQSSVRKAEMKEIER